MKSGPNVPAELREEDVRRAFVEDYNGSRGLFDSRWRSEAEEHFSAYSADQLSEKRKTWLAETGSAEAGIRLTPRAVNTLTGIDASSTFPNFTADSFPVLKPVAEFLNDMFMAVAARSAFQSSVFDVYHNRNVCGYGHLAMDTMPNGPYRSIGYASKNIWGVFPDPVATTSNLMDGRFIIDRGVIHRRDLFQRYPEAEDGFQAAKLMNMEIMPVTKGGESSPGVGSEGGSDLKDYLYFFHYQFKRQEPKRVLVFGDGLKRAVFESEAEGMKSAALSAQTSVEEAGGILDEAYYSVYLVANTDGRGAIPLEINRSSYSSFSTLTATGYKQTKLGEEKVIFFGEPRLITPVENTINRAVRVYIDAVARSGGGGAYFNMDAIPGGHAAFLKRQSIPGTSDILSKTHDEMGRPMMLPKPEGKAPVAYSQLIEMLLQFGSSNPNVSDIQTGNFRVHRTSRRTVDAAAQAASNPISPMVYARERFVWLIGHRFIEMVQRMEREDVMRFVDLAGYGDDNYDPHAFLQMASPEAFMIETSDGSDTETDSSFFDFLSQSGVLQSLQQEGIRVAPILKDAIKGAPIKEESRKSLVGEIERQLQEQQEQAAQAQAAAAQGQQQQGPQGPPEEVM